MNPTASAKKYLLERSFNNQRTRKCDALRVFCFPAEGLSGRFESRAEGLS
jgi:hypothetical protein